MPRGVSPAMMAALRSGAFHPVAMLFLDWPGAPVRAHTGHGTMSWGGQSWLGAQGVGSLEIPGEAIGIVPEGAVAVLKAVPPNLYDLLGVPIRGRAGIIWAGVTTEPGGNVLIGEPVQMFAGYVDSRRWTVQAEGADLVHSILIELAAGQPARAAANLFHSDEDQRRVFPSDTAGRLLLTLDRKVKTLVFPAP